ncbi:MAG: glutamate-1-semialdehyde-2,1-aminomutase [Gammaproteobacteria bacterium]|nr:glutamate-1-semialdehyde-2,1-aminomutase [Gammaproteobacteria bacterium]|tara:strand:- start:929 stop:2230 length:1302 start_codon:yes stop_codon:yes gene_type:complete
MSEALTNKRSETLFAQAKEHIPGGVNSPVRAFKGVGGSPVFFKRGEGAWVYDEDDNAYIDYIGAWGPLILGHCHPKVIAALKAQLDQGLAFGAPTQHEVQMADRICELMPSIESVRLVNSGTEATMSAIRLARGVTGKDKVVKFEGCYHGHVDSLLVKAGSGALTLGSPDSAGIPKSTAEQTFIVPYNDTGIISELFQKHGHEIACLIVEPVAGNMNCVPPLPGFLQTLRELCTEHDSLLIFDEVMTGFRVALGGAQSVYQVQPDLTTLGKVIGGGMPVGAFGGKKEFMNQLAPSGPVYQAGTLSGNPLAVTAGLVMLEEISQAGFYDKLQQNAASLLSGLQERADQAGIAFSTNQVGAMFGCFFSEEKTISSFTQVMNCDVERFKKYFHVMLQHGIYLAPSAFEAGFISSAHGEREIQLTLDAAEAAFSQLK